MGDPQHGKRVSLARAFSDILQSMPWFEYLAWVGAITVLPLLSIVFAGYRIWYERLVMQGDGSLPRFDRRRPLTEVGTAIAASVITVVLLYATAIPVYWGVIRPLHLPYDRVTFFTVFGILFAAVQQCVVVIVILPFTAHHSRLRRFATSIRCNGGSFVLAAVAAILVQAATYLGYRLTMPFWSRGGIRLPRFDDPRALVAYYAAMAAIVFATLFGELVVTHLFGQLGRGSFDALIESRQGEKAEAV